MVVRFYSSVAPETTLSNTINSSAVTITVGSVSGFPALTPYTLALDYEGATEELIQVNSAAGTNLSITRAIDGTSATSHNAGARVRHVSSARDFADSRTHENSDQGIHGLDPAEEIVGTNKAQTLTNKTLDSPAFTGSFTGTLQGGPAATDKIRLDNTTDVNLSSTDHAFQIGLDSGVNLRMDNNEIQAANNGVPAGLAIQPDGGVALFNLNGTADYAGNVITANGTVNANVVNVSRAGSTSAAIQARVGSEAQPRYRVRSDGAITWGPGGTTALDTTLYRNAAGSLTVGDNLTVNNTIAANNATIPTLNGSVSVNGNVTANNIRAGTATTPAQSGGSDLSQVNVTFSPAMTGVPAVGIMVNTSVTVGSPDIQWYADNVTSGGFTLKCRRTTNSATNFMWTAILPTQ